MKRKDKEKLHKGKYQWRGQGRSRPHKIASLFLVLSWFVIIPSQEETRKSFQGGKGAVAPPPILVHN